jgi:hypothetical protein
MLNSTRASRDKKFESIFLISSKNKQELVKKDLRVTIVSAIAQKLSIALLCRHQHGGSRQ